MGFDTKDLLRQTGYSEGDIVPVIAIQFREGGTRATTSTSFVEAAGAVRAVAAPRAYANDQGTLVGRLSFFATVGTGETYDARVETENDGDVLASVTDVTSGGSKAGSFTEFSLTNPDEVQDLRYVHRTKPGSNSSGAADGLFTIGIQL